MEKKSLAELRGFSPGQLTRHVVLQKDGGTAMVFNLSPGQSIPEHKHPGKAVFVLVLEGSGTVSVDGADSAAAPGDVFYVEDEERFAFVNTGGEPCRLYVVLSTLPGAQEILGGTGGSR